jgi:hypothetical protein
MSDANQGQGEGTNTAPIFVQNAKDLIARLAPHAEDPLAGTMLRDATRLLDDFESWKTQRPANDVRIAGIQQLMNLNRRAMDYLTKGVASQPAQAPERDRERTASLFRRLLGRFGRQRSESEA